LSLFFFFFASGLFIPSSLHGFIASVRVSPSIVRAKTQSAEGLVDPRPIFFFTSRARYWLSSADSFSEISKFA